MVCGAAPGMLNAITSGPPARLPVTFACMIAARRVHSPAVAVWQILSLIFASMPSPVLFTTNILTLFATTSVLTVTFVLLPALASVLLNAVTLAVRVNVPAAVGLTPILNAWLVPPLMVLTRQVIFGFPVHPDPKLKRLLPDGRVVVTSTKLAVSVPLFVTVNV